MQNNSRVKLLLVIAVTAFVVLVGSLAVANTTTIGINVSTASITATGNISTNGAGNLIIGNGVPGVTQNGEDAYIEGTLEVDGATTLDGTLAINGSTVTLTQAAANTGSPAALTINGGAHTGLTASTEATDVNLNLARTVQFATGALTTQRAIRIGQPTYAFVGASVIDDAATFVISGAPVAGANATITRSYALWSAGGGNRFDGNVGIGIAPGADTALMVGDAAVNDSTQLSVIAHTRTDTGNVTPIANYIRSIANPAGASSASFNAQFVISRTATGLAQNVSGVVGANFAAQSNLNAANTTSFATGFLGQVSNVGGTTTTARGAWLAIINTSGTITTSQGAFIASPSIAAGSIGTAYGLYVDNITGATTANYGAYIVGGNTAALAIVQAAVAGGSPAALTITGGAHTASTASAELTDINFNLTRTVQFATGALTTQRAMRIGQPTYDFVEASTLSTAMTVEVAGPPQAGTNATITTGTSFQMGGSGSGTNAATASHLQIYPLAIKNGYGAMTTLAGMLYTDGGAGVLLGNQTATLTNLNAVRLDSITYTSTTLVRTVTNPATLYIGGAPIAGENVTFDPAGSTALALWVDAGTSRFDGHINSTQTTAPTTTLTTTTLNDGGGSGAAIAVTAGSTDTAGSFTVTAGNGTPTAGIAGQIVFNAAYSAAPKSVILTSRDADGTNNNVYVSSVSTTQFQVNFNTALGSSEAVEFYYWVIE